MAEKNLEKSLKQTGSEATPRFLYGFCMVLFFLLSIFCNQIGKYYVTGQLDYAFSLHLFLVVAQLFFGTFVIYLGVSRFKVKIKAIPIVILSLLFVSSLIGTYGQTNVSTPFTSLIYSFNWLEKLESILTSWSIYFGLYVLYIFGPALKSSRYALNIIVEMFILIAYISLVASFFTDASAYYEMFVEGNLINHNGIKGFQGNKNIFANFLFIGIIGELTLIEYTKQKARWISVAILLFFLILASSKTLMIIAPLTVLVYFGRCTGLKLKKGLKSAWPYVLILSLLLIGTIIIIVYNFFHLDDIEYGTIETRFENWNVLLGFITGYPANFLCGFGDNLYNILISGNGSDYNGTGLGYSDNGLIEIIGRGGIFRLTAYLGLLAYLLYRIFRRFGENRKDVYVCLFCMIAIIVRNIFDCETLFDTCYESVAYICIVVLPILSNHSESRQSQRAGKISMKSFWYSANNALFYLMPSLIIPLAMIGIWEAIFLVIICQGLWIYLSRYRYGKWKLLSGFTLFVDVAFLLFALFYPRSSNLSLFAYSLTAAIGGFTAFWVFDNFQGISALPILENVYLKTISLAQRTN